MNFIVQIPSTVEKPHQRLPRQREVVITCYPVRQITDLLPDDVPDQVVRQALRDGILPSFVCGGRRLVSRRALGCWLRRRSRERVTDIVAGIDFCNGEQGEQGEQNPVPPAPGAGDGHRLPQWEQMQLSLEPGERP